jgi:hypothetical protein
MTIYKVSKNTLRKVQGVSYPRCGHHLLVNCLLAYFGETPYVQKTHGESIIPELLGSWNFTYCEFYNHCNQVPCACPHTTFQKNHDYDYHNPTAFWEKPTEGRPKPGEARVGSSLDTIRKQNGIFYLIQYRDALPSIVSYYKIKTLHGDFQDWTPTGSIRFPDTIETWKTQAVRFKKDWNRFMERWVRHPLPTSFLLRYEDFLQRPAENLKQVIEFFDPNGKVDENFLHDIIRAQNIEPKFDLMKFKYYDAEFFEYLKGV